MTAFQEEQQVQQAQQAKTQEPLRDITSMVSNSNQAASSSSASASASSIKRNREEIHACGSTSCDPMSGSTSASIDEDESPFKRMRISSPPVASPAVANATTAANAAVAMTNLTQQPLPPCWTMVGAGQHVVYGDSHRQGVATTTIPSRMVNMTVLTNRDGMLLFMKNQRNSSPVNSSNHRPRSRNHYRWLSLEAWSSVIEFCDTRTWIQLSYTCRALHQFVRVPYVVSNKKYTVKGSIDNQATLHRYLQMNRGRLFNVWFTKPDLVNDETLSFLRGSIIELDIQRCSQVTDQGMMYLKGTIQVLRMSGCTGVTDHGLENLAGTIRSLDMDNCSAITDNGLRHLRGTIKELSIAQCRYITDAGLDHLRGTIKTLSLYGCRGITNFGLASLTGTIQHLNIAGCLISDAGLAHLSPTIQSLDISHCTHVTDQGLIHLRDCVQTLTMFNCTGVTQQGIESLRNGPFIFK